jgi:hypothetical protein
MKAIRRQEIRRIGDPTGGVQVHPLLDAHENIVSAVDKFLGLAGSDIIVDISCFPKRFFFPFLKRILAVQSIRNLVVTYTVPAEYYQGTLAEDHRSLAPLPLFGIEEFPEPKPQVAIISIGFVPLGISELVNPDQHGVEFKLLFPFPPGPPNFQRNWRFVAQLEETLPLQSEPLRVEAYNVPDTFDHIVEITSHGKRPAVFAPYGPKPISLAMCLFAIATGSPVYYTQPQTYHPQYSTGVKKINGSLLSYGYCLRINGRDLYSVNLMDS